MLSLSRSRGGSQASAVDTNLWTQARLKLHKGENMAEATSPGMLGSAAAPVDLSGYPTCFSPGDPGLLGLRIGALFGILAVSAVGVMIPYFTYTAKLHSVFFLLRAFAAGVVLTTGYVHVLGDAYPLLTDPCLGLAGNYPWAMTFATAASLVTFTLEWCLGRLFFHKLAQIEAQNASQASKEVSDAEAATQEEEAKSRVKVLQMTVISYTFECGIIFHSIFIGITLGISSNASTVTALFIALMFHQGNEGLALGVLFMKANYSRLKYLLLAAAFVIVTPLGVAIGIAVNSNYNKESKAALGSEGVLDSVSAGILIYNGLCDLIVPTFAVGEIPKTWWVQAMGFGSLFAGAAIMALIGKWA